MQTAVTAVRDRSRYQGKNLGLLLLAMALPAAMLYLRILLGTVTGYSRGITPVQQGRLALISNLALAAYFLLQLICARYIQRLVPQRETRVGISLQYLAVLGMCAVFSVIGAVLFEAFGVTILLRTGHF